MGDIRDRVLDAELLWKGGRQEGAFLVALCAVAGIAERRYPKLKDREKFERFLSENGITRFQIEHRGSLHTIESIFYKLMRCKLVHEGGLPDDIKLVIEGNPNTRHVRAGGAPEFVMHIGYGWFDFLISAVKHAPEYARL